MTVMLDWQSAGPWATTHSAVRSDGSVYRIVESGDYFCLRLERPGENHQYMGQFPTLAQAKVVAQEHDDGTRRLKAWERYMMRHDPPATTLPPNWEPT